MAQMSYCTRILVPKNLPECSLPDSSYLLVPFHYLYLSLGKTLTKIRGVVITQHVANQRADLTAPKMNRVSPISKLPRGRKVECVTEIV